LISDGYSLSVFDLRSKPIKELERLGAIGCQSAKEISKRSEIVIIMVRSTEQAKKTVLGRDGVLKNMKEGSFLIIMSTVDPSFCMEVAKSGRESKIGVIDAPVSGGTSGASRDAKEGRLTIIVGGEEAVFERCRRVLESWSDKLFYAGPIGAGQTVKIANNLMLNINVIGVFEAISLVARAGIDPEYFLKIANHSSGESWATRNWHFWRKLKSEQQFNGLQVTKKDIQLALSMSEDQGLDLPLAQCISKYDLNKLIG
jgi:3-hydroxyisobutyrate dehydrogenase